MGEILDTLPFPIQHIQTDGGTEFFNDNFQPELHEHFIKFRPIKPRTLHLNDKVERTQQTDKNEFWSLLDLSYPNLDFNALAFEWHDFYNKKKPYSSLGGETPYQKLKEVSTLIPIQTDIKQKFWESDEKILPRNYQYLKYLKQKNKKGSSKP